MLIRNVCPTGADRVISDTGQDAPHGHQIEVDDKTARRLLEQSDVWEPVKASTSKKGDKE